MGAALLVLTGQGCGHRDTAGDDPGILLVMNDSTLRMEDVTARIPVGLDPRDSAALFHEIVGEWIEGNVLRDMASQRIPDYTAIERKVEAYRNRLIVAEYMQLMRRGRDYKSNPDSVKRFYDLHRREMVTETPLVKGVFVKVPASSRLDGIRRCLSAPDWSGLDALENDHGAELLQYEYFGDRWVDWTTVAERIPYRFYDPEAFLTSTSDFETESGGTAYLLHIAEWLPAGSEMPYDFAAPRIMAMLEQNNLARYEKALVRSLVGKALEEGKLRAVGYDPLAGRMTHDTSTQLKQPRQK